MKAAPIELPEKYYLDYFEMLIMHVQKHYGDILSKEEKSFIRRYYNLPEDAQCLFLRLVNRRGQYFRIDKISYEEISDLPSALTLLLKRKFFKKLSFHSAVELLLVLHTFTKAELIELAKQLMDKQALAALRKLKKQELAASLLARCSPRQLIILIRSQELIIRTCHEEELEMLKFLYFGHLEGDMTQFVVRDIGYVKTESYDEKKLKALFKSRQEAVDKLRLSKVYREFKQLRDDQQVSADVIFRWFVSLNMQRKNISELALPHFDKLCLRLGKLLEQQQFTAQALSVYQHTDTAPSRERQVRLLQKQGDTKEALRLCSIISEKPANADERFFAEDFINRVQHKKRTRSATDYLRKSDKIILPNEHQYYVEQGVLSYLQAEGHEGVHVENYLWRGMFGLLFWDIIFDQESEAIHNPLQTAPSDLYTPQFLNRRTAALHKRLKVLSYPKRFLNIIRHHHESKQGMNNPMVGWHESLLPLVEQCYHYLEPEQIGSVLLEMARDLRENTRGFPDLFIWKENSYSFIEVKSPNDQLSAQQLYWLHFFEKQRISARVIRVAWS
jgi:hypothetical protein